MFKGLFSRQPKQTRSTYLQKREPASLDEVIQHGIADFKARLSNDKRPTIEGLIAANKRRLASMPSSWSMQEINRAKLYGLKANLHPHEIEATYNKQGIGLTLSTDTLSLFAGHSYPAGAMMPAYPMYGTKFGRTIHMSLLASAGYGSSDTRSGVIRNTLPADLEPLYYAYVAAHEEGHAIDHTNTQIIETQLGKQVFKDEQERIETQLTKISQDQPNLNRKLPAYKRDWLKSIEETRQDIYGLMRAASYAKAHGYTKEDMLALCDYAIDRREAADFRGLKEYCVQTGLHATRKLIDTHGLDAPEYIEKTWGNPRDHIEQQTLHVSPNTLHQGVRQWVHTRKLYLNPEVYTAFNYSLEDDPDINPALSPDTQSELKELKNNRDMARQALFKAESTFDKSDAEHVNAIIARQGTREGQAQELTAMYTATLQVDRKLEGTHFHAYHAGRTQYLKELFDTEYNKTTLRQVIDKAREQPTPAPTPARTISYMYHRPEQAFNASCYWVNIERQDAGQYTMTSREIPHTYTCLEQEIARTHAQGGTFVHPVDRKYLYALLNAAKQCGAVVDPENHLEASPDSTQVKEQRHARALLLQLEKAATGEQHMVQSLQQAQLTLKEIQAEKQKGAEQDRDVPPQPEINPNRDTPER